MAGEGVGGAAISTQTGAADVSEKMWGAKERVGGGPLPPHPTTHCTAPIGRIPQESLVFSRGSASTNRGRASVSSSRRLVAVQSRTCAVAP